MRRVIKPKINFAYLNRPESQKRLQMAYRRIFVIAKQNLLKRKAMGIKSVHESTLLDTESTLSYT